MKFLKYTLGIIAVLILGFLALGFIKPNISYTSEILVDKNTFESWQVLQDPDKLADWLPGFEKMEHLSGTPGAVGAVSNVYFNQDGQPMVIKETITEIVPQKSISMIYESDFMNMDYTLELTDVDGKTRINTHTTATGNGVFSKSLMVILSGTIHNQEDINLANLKKTIEENTKSYLPTEE